MQKNSNDPARMRAVQLELPFDYNDNTRLKTYGDLYLAMVLNPKQLELPLKYRH
jgi:hypothetical protein